MAAKKAAAPAATGLAQWLKTNAPKAGNYMKSNPGMSLGLGLAGTANLAGLVDNDQILGQLGGAGLGAAAPSILTKLGVKGLGSLGVPGTLLAAGVGGGLGSVFDQLLAKQNQEQDQMQQFQMARLMQGQ